MFDGESLLRNIDDQKMPPVDSWDPPYCGELDLQIKSDGSWFYQGTPIGRRRLQILFSRIIKKEANDYFLVTPVEKVAIRVDWMPFTIVDFDHRPAEPGQRRIFQFRDNCDNQFRLTHSDHWALDFSQGQPLPVVQVRRNLFASFSRSCYYRLLEETSIVAKHDKRQVQLISNGIPFSLGEYIED